MNCRLLADAGSTKVAWVILSPEGKVKFSLETSGMNALLADDRKIADVLCFVESKIPSDIFIEEIYYYGAGCATENSCKRMLTAFSNIWNGADCYIASDLLGAARSLLGDEKGVACILGTGSNSCFYDGNRIVSQIPALGYILGDEGSGAALGKRLLGDVLKKQLPKDIRDTFFEEYSISLSEILERLYNTSSPNSFLASFVPFLGKNIWHPSIYALIFDEFTCFMRRNVSMYSDVHSMPINFTGSIAFHFSHILQEAASSLGFSVKKITERPMDGLIDYHSHCR